MTEILRPVLSDALWYTLESCVDVDCVNRVHYMVLRVIFNQISVLQEISCHIVHCRHSHRSGLCDRNHGRPQRRHVQGGTHAHGCTWKCKV